MLSTGRNIVLFIHAGHPIETEAARLSRLDFARFGLELREFSVVGPDAENELKEILRSDGDCILFFYSMNFWALNIHQGSTLVHDATGIPLAIMMHDHPVYFLHQLSRALNGTIIVAPGDELPDFIAKHYGIEAEVIPDPGYRPHMSDHGAEPDFEKFRQRKNALLCPMNLCVYGLNINDIWSRIGSLPRSRSERAKRLIDAALTDSVTPLHIVSEKLTSIGDSEIAVEDLRWVMDFIKVWRRMRVVRALLDFPALFSTAYVPPEFNKYRSKFTLLDRSETIPLYGDFRFTVNVNPLIDCLHERVTEALRNQSVCVTDPNGVIATNFVDAEDMLFIDYKNDNLGARVSELLDNPEKAFALTVSSDRKRRLPHFAGSAHQRLIAAVRERWTN